MFSCFKDKDFLKKFIVLTLPVMISSFISFCSGFLDNIMVGTVSNEAVSGIYAASQVSYLFLMAVYGILEGPGIFIQQYKGINSNKDIKQCFRYKIYIGIILLLVFMPLAYLLGDDLIYFYCKTDSNVQAIYEEGINYSRIVLISFIPYTFSCAISSTLKETGETKYPMIASIISVVANFLFNALFIFAFKMGGIGAAIATVIARVLELVFILVIVLIKKYPFMTKVFDTFRIENDLLKSIMKKSVFLFINELGFASGMMLQSLAFSQRDGVLSAISIVSTLGEMFSVLANSMAVGVGVMVGQELGRSDFSKARDVDKKLHFLGFYIALTIGMVMIILSPYIPNLFPEVDSAQKILASKLIIIYSCTYFGATLCVISYFTLRAGGKTLLTLIFDSGSAVCLYVPVAWTLAKLTNLNIVYVYLIVLSIDYIKATIGLIFIKKGTWANNITIQNNTKMIEGEI